MNAATVVGFVRTSNTLTLCADCHALPRWAKPCECTAIFPTEEVDVPMYCDECAHLIPTALTSDGEKYVQRKVRRHDGFEEVLAAWRAEWPYLFAGAE